jgi:hypothetical protein
MNPMDDSVRPMVVPPMVEASRICALLLLRFRSREAAELFPQINVPALNNIPLNTIVRRLDVMANSCLLWYL